MDNKEQQADTEEYSLEPLRDEDIPLFIELDREASSYELGPNYYERLNKWYGDNIRVVRHNGEIVGAVYVLAYGIDTHGDEDDPHGEVISVAVAEDERRKGVGEKLLRFAIDRLKERRCVSHGTDKLSTTEDF